MSRARPRTLLRDLAALLLAVLVLWTISTTLADSEADAHRAGLIPPKPPAPTQAPRGDPDEGAGRGLLWLLRGRSCGLRAPRF